MREIEPLVDENVGTAFRAGWGWREEAACNEWAVDLWYDKEVWDIGKDICLTECPVRFQCLTYALRAKEKWGVWGGLDPKERKRMRRKE